MVPVKNPETNEMTTQSRTVEGPVAIFMTTTAAEIDEELQNRFLVLTVDESAEQTAAVHAAQRSRETRAGFLARAQAQAVRQLHHDAQHLVERIAVVNPYADRLTFAGRTPRTRRDHAKYLRLIRAITLLHQHQRERTTDTIHGQTLTWIETTPEDIAAANALAGSVLGRSLDELAPPTRRLLNALRTLTEARAQLTGRTRDAVRLTRREIREHTSMAPTPLHVHLSRLVDLEYVHAFKGATTSSQCYAVVWDGEGTDGSRFLVGLTVPGQETSTYDGKDSDPQGKDSGSEGEHSAPIPVVFRPFSGGFPTRKNNETADGIQKEARSDTKLSEKRHWDGGPAVANIVDVGIGSGATARQIRLAPLSVWG